MAEEISDLEYLAASQDPEVEIESQRFAKPASEDFVQRIAESSIPTGTRRTMNWAEKMWTTWLSSRSEDDVPEVHRKALSKKIFEVDNVYLQWLLKRFVLEVRNERGEHYPPDTLYGLCLSFQKVVNVCGRRIESFFSSFDFSPFTQVLNSEMKRLRKLGVGTVRRQAAALSGTEEEKL